MAQYFDVTTEKLINAFANLKARKAPIIHKNGEPNYVNLLVEGLARIKARNNIEALDYFMDSFFEYAEDKEPIKNTLFSLINYTSMTNNGDHRVFDTKSGDVGKIISDSIFSNSLFDFVQSNYLSKFREADFDKFKEKELIFLSQRRMLASSENILEKALFQSALTKNTELFGELNAHNIDLISMARKIDYHKFDSHEFNFRDGKVQKFAEWYLINRN